MRRALRLTSNISRLPLRGNAVLPFFSAKLFAVAAKSAARGEPARFPPTCFADKVANSFLWADRCGGKAGKVYNFTTFPPLLGFMDNSYRVTHKLHSPDDDSGLTALTNTAPLRRCGYICLVRSYLFFDLLLEPFYTSQITDKVTALSEQLLKICAFRGVFRHVFHADGRRQSLNREIIGKTVR